MNTNVVLSFSIEALADERTDVLSVVPVLSGIPLTELVSRFEYENGLEPSGGYGGLVPTWFTYGPLDHYFMGTSSNPHFDAVDGYYLLGCQCGEVGCWPLQARIRHAGETMIWDMFRQPHRPDRDYSLFGPFTFELEQYRSAASELASRFPGS